MKKTAHSHDARLISLAPRVCSGLAALEQHGGAPNEGGGAPFFQGDAHEEIS